MRRILTAIAATGLALAAAAQQPQRCLSPQLLNGLVFLGRSDLKVDVQRAQPGFMSGVGVPAQLNLIGSGVRPDGTSMVAYKTSLPGGKAFDAVAAALEADGWEREATPGSQQSFSAATSPREGTFCRSGERRHVLVTEIAGTGYVNVVNFLQMLPRACHAAAFLPDFSIAQRAPRFQFPEGTVIIQAGGGSGSTTVHNSTVRISSAEVPMQLLEHLAGQLESQGWQGDARWSGLGGAGSIWRRKDGEAASGILEIIPVGNGAYDIDFTISLPQ